MVVRHLDLQEKPDTVAGFFNKIPENHYFADDVPINTEKEERRIYGNLMNYCICIYDLK